MEFEWDPAKAERNLLRHGVGFTEAMTVFGDSLEVTVSDRRHSEGESRLLSLGMSEAGRLLVVAYAERAGKIRIISVRQASPKERRDYESGSG